MNGSIPCPCGQCLPCRINRRRVWTHRILLESFTTPPACFLTLTYDDDNVPVDGSLRPDHVQKFMKRFRKAVSPAVLRFFLVGEYGDDTQRPHYHVAVFGFNCSGKISVPESGRRCFCSNCELVREVWGKGNIVIDELSRESSQYIAGYVIKKMTVQSDPRLQGRYPEFARMSNRPGIGRVAAEKIFDAMRGNDGNYYLPAGGDVPAQLSVDGRLLPLGRYLKGKLREKFVSYDKETGEICGVAEKAKQKFLQEMQSLWDVACVASEPPLSLKHALLAQNAGRVALLESKFQIYRREKLL